MQTTTSQEFNRQASALRHRATAEPLLITDRGRPANVLMSYPAYQALQGPAQSVADCVGHAYSRRAGRGVAAFP